MISKLNWLKKVFWFVILSTAYFIIAQQISYSQSGTSIGIKAGEGFSRYYFIRIDQGHISQSYIPVFQTGLVFSQINKKNCGIQFEINYIQKGWKQTFDSEPTTYSVKMDNIEFPFLTHFRLGKKKSAIIINMGLHFSYAYNLKVDSLGSALDTIALHYGNLKLSPFDYGLDIGLGYEFGRDRGVFQVQLMFSQGLSNFINRDTQDPLVIYRSINQSLFLSCVYKIPLTRKKKASPN